MRGFDVISRAGAVTAVLLLLACSLLVIAPGADAATTNDWISGKDLLEGRTDAAVVVNESGIAFTFGGLSSVDPIITSNTSTSYNLTTGATEKLPNMNVSVYGASSSLGADGRIYIFGGMNGTINVANTQIYDPDNRTWSSGPAMTYPVMGAKAVTYDGLIYVFGGYNGGGTFATVQIYDPVTGTWSLGTPMPGFRMNGAVIADEDHIYYIGGAFNINVATNDVYQYDPHANTWTTVAHIPVGVEAAAAVRGADGFFYVMGGSLNSTYNATGFSSVSYYDPFTDVWGSASMLPYPVKYASAASLKDGRIFLLGGNSETHISKAAISLPVMTTTVTLSRSSLSAGETAKVTVTTVLKYAHGETYSLFPVLRDAEGVPYAITYSQMTVSFESPFSFELTIPESATPGTYHLQLYRYSVEYDGGSCDVTVPEIAITVDNGPTTSENIAALTAQVQDLKTQLDEASANLNSTASQQDVDKVSNSLESKTDNTTSYLMVGMLVAVIAILVVMIVALRRK